MSDNDPRIAEAVKILETGTQRQDSLADQLNTVIQLAQAAGCYDVVDRLRALL